MCWIHKFQDKIFILNFLNTCYIFLIFTPSKISLKFGLSKISDTNFNSCFLQKFTRTLQLIDFITTFDCQDSKIIYLII